MEGVAAVAAAVSASVMARLVVLEVGEGGRKWCVLPLHSAGQGGSVEWMQWKVEFDEESVDEYHFLLHP